MRFKKGVSFSVSDPQDIPLSLKKEVQLTQIAVMFEQPVSQWTYMTLQALYSSEKYVVV